MSLASHDCYTEASRLCVNAGFLICEYWTYREFLGATAATAFATLQKMAEEIVRRAIVQHHVGLADRHKLAGEILLQRAQPYIRHIDESPSVGLNHCKLPLFPS